MYNVEKIKEYINGNDGRDFAYNFSEEMEKGNIVASVKSVSRDGMSRKINFYYLYVNPMDGRITPISLDKMISVVADLKMGKRNGFEDGVIIRGCGMDMIQQTLRVVYNNLQEWSNDNICTKAFDQTYKGYILI